MGPEGAPLDDRETVGAPLKGDGNDVQHVFWTRPCARCLSDLIIFIPQNNSVR